MHIDKLWLLETLWILFLTYVSQKTEISSLNLHKMYIEAVWHGLQIWTFSSSVEQRPTSSAASFALLLHPGHSPPPTAPSVRCRAVSRQISAVEHSKSSFSLILQRKTRLLSSGPLTAESSRSTGALISPALDVPASSAPRSPTPHPINRIS